MSRYALILSCFRHRSSSSLFDVVHSQAVGQRSVDVEGLFGDTVALVDRQGFEGAHVVQAVGELDQNDAQVIGHGEDHLAKVLGQFFLVGPELDLADLGQTVDQFADIGAELAFDVIEGDDRVFDDIVEDGGDDRGDVELEVGQDDRHFQRVGDVRLSGMALLGSMALRAKSKAL